MSSISVENISKHLNSEIGFYPVRTKIVKVPNEGWEEFCKSNNWDSTSSGAFSPRTLTAYLREEGEFGDLNLIHEFFGHGIFMEYHPLEKRITARGSVTKEIKSFSELFAIWLEFYFSKRFELKKTF